MMTQERTQQNLVGKCVLVKDIPPGTSDCDLLALFPSANRVSVGQETGVALALFGSEREAQQQLGSSLRHWGDGKSTVEIDSCPPELIPAEWLQSLPDSEFSIVHSNQILQSLLSLHSYPQGDTTEEGELSGHFHLSRPVTDHYTYPDSPIYHPPNFTEKLRVEFDGVCDVIDETRSENSTYNHVSTTTHGTHELGDSHEVSTHEGSHYPRDKNRTLGQKDNTVRLEGNIVKQVDNTVRQEDNTVRQEDNTVRQEDNTVRQKDNTVRQEDNTVRQEDNTVRQEENTVRQEDNTVRQEDNTVRPEDNSSVNSEDSYPEETSLGGFQQIDTDSSWEVNSETGVKYHPQQTGESPPPSYYEAITNPSGFMYRGTPQAVIEDQERELTKFSQIESMADNSGVECTCIEVGNIPDGVNEEELELYFGNKRRSGGGEVEGVRLNKKQHSAVIQFKHPKAVNIVLQKCPLLMRDKKISVDHYFEPQETEPAIQSDDFSEQQCVVKVTGLPADLPNEYLQLYFESKKSGGGDVDNIEYRPNGAALITFTDSKVAERVLSRPGHEIRNTEIKVARWKRPAQKSICVSGFKPPVDREMLELFFENEKKSGGGDIREIQMLEDSTALVTFQEEAVCQRVLGRPNLTFSGCSLCVSLWEEEEDVTEEQFRTVLVTGVQPDTSEELIKLLFENEKKSKGGDVEEIYQEEDGNVIITFKLKEVAQRVIDYGKTGQLLLAKKPLSVSPMAPKSKGHVSPQSKQVKIVDTIQVTGNIDNVSTEMLSLYFENSKRSGGGEITRQFRDENGKMLITFANPKVLRSVLSKREHRVEGETLEVSMHTPQPVIPKDPHKFFIEGVGPETTDECLNMYIENKCRHEPKRIVAGERPGTFMLFFKEEVDLPHFKKACEKQPLEDCYLTVSAVPISNCIRVTNISPKTTRDALRFYFENKKRSGGGAVSEVKLFKEEAYALVSFTDHQDLDKVLGRQHSLEKHKLSLSVHYDCLGLVSLDGKDLPLLRPDPEDVPIDQRVLEFFLHSPLNQQALEQQLSQVGGHVDWSQCRGQMLKVICTIDKSEKNRRLFMTWRKTVNTAVKEYLDMFKVEEVSCLQETWSSIKEGMKSTDFGLKEGGLIRENDVTKTVVIVGHRHIVEQCKVEVEKLKQTIEQDIEHQKKVIKEVKELEHFQMLFLRIQKLQDTVEAKHPRLKVKLNFQQNFIEFCGLPTEIASAKLVMYEEIQIMKNTKLTLSPCICDLLESSAQVKKLVSSQFREKGVKAVWDIKGTDVMVYAATDKHIVEGAQLIKIGLVETIVKIKRESAQLLSSGKWHEMVKGLENSYEGRVNIIPASDKSQVTIVATSDIIAGVMEVIKDFLQANTILNELTQLDCGRASFISKYKMAEITALEKSLQQHSVSIEINSQSDTPGMQVRGTEMGIQQCKVKLEDITGKVSTRRYHVQKPGFPKYLQSEKGKDFLQTVETKFKVIIRESSQQDASVSEEDFVVVPKPSSQGPTIRATVSLPQNRKVLVVKGDMTAYKVDAIVNAANGQLKHGGGLAGAIIRKGGRSIQEESDAYVKEHGLLLEGNVAVTGPGSLPCTVIIHAVGPVWKGGRSREEELLDEAVFESIEAAAKFNLRSIAVPALSTGIYGYPLTSAVNTITEAVESYFKEEPNSSIKEVHLIDISDQTVNQFVSALTNLFGQDKVQEFREKPAVSSRRSLKWKPGSGDSSIVSGAAKLNSSGVVTRSGLQICLVKGELAKQKADVLVNSTGKDMALKNGAVSKSLLTAAGSRMQSEASSLYPNGFQTQGEVLVTKGHKLSCKEVYHGCLPGWKSDIAKPAEGLEQFVLSCLKKADGSGYSSIAFPALGSGNLRYPDAVVATSLYKTVVTFSDNTPNSSLKTVSFVVFPGTPSTVKAFEDQRRKLSGQPHDSGLSGRRRNRTFNGPAADGKGRPFQASPVQEEEIFPLQKINFVISQGDITQAPTDAIVNSTNEQLDLQHGAISGAILRAAGEQILEECRPLVPAMKKKGHVVTGSGNLKCKHIIHIDAQSKHSWKAKMVMCLEAANLRGASSVAFPAVGTGVVKKDPEQIAKDMFDAINEFQSSGNSNVSIKDVRLVVFEETMVSRIKHGLRKCFSNAGAAPKSWFRKMFSGVAELFTGSDGTGAASGEETKSRKEIALVIISDQKKAIDDAIQKIETILKDEMQDRVIEGTWSESIKNLSDRHMAEIFRCENEQDVKIKVEKRVGRIRIQGMPNDVMAAFEKITAILKETDRIVHEAEASEFVTNIVQWYYIDSEADNPTAGQHLVKYDKTLNMMLEKAFLAKDRLKSITDDNGDKYCYNFDTMEEYPEDDPNDKVKLIRKEVNAQGSRFEPPATWSEMADKDLLIVDLQSTDSEYQTVVNNLQGQIGNISKIERIQNRSLYEQYMAKKGKIERANPTKTVEKTLWHGTSSDTIPSINNYGFNRSYCGKNATAFGNGVYFAVNPQYSASHTYARPDAAGHKRIYQTRVLVGDYTQGQPGMIVPPTKSGHILYDSVVNHAGNPGMFIIFHDAQAYPEYLITFS